MYCIGHKEDKKTVASRGPYKGRVEQVLIPTLLDLAHQFSMARRFQLLFGGSTIKFGMDVVAALAGILYLLDDQGGWSWRRHPGESL